MSSKFLLAALLVVTGMSLRADPCNKNYDCDCLVAGNSMLRHISSDILGEKGKQSTFAKENICAFFVTSVKRNGSREVFLQPENVDYPYDLWMAMDGAPGTIVVAHARPYSHKEDIETSRFYAHGALVQINNVRSLRLSVPSMSAGSGDIKILGVLLPHSKIQPVGNRVSFHGREGPYQIAGGYDTPLSVAVLTNAPYDAWVDIPGAPNEWKVAEFLGQPPDTLVTTTKTKRVQLKGKYENGQVYFGMSLAFADTP